MNPYSTDIWTPEQRVAFVHCMECCLAMREFALLVPEIAKDGYHPLVERALRASIKAGNTLVREANQRNTEVSAAIHKIVESGPEQIYQDDAYFYFACALIEHCKLGNEVREYANAFAQAHTWLEMRGIETGGSFEDLLENLIHSVMIVERLAFPVRN